MFQKSGLFRDRTEFDIRATATFIVYDFNYRENRSKSLWYTMCVGVQITHNEGGFSAATCAKKRDLIEIDNSD